MGSTTRFRVQNVIYEVFRQERKGQPFAHAGSVEAPNDEFADWYAREEFGAAASRSRSGSSRREAVHEISSSSTSSSATTTASTAIR